MAAISIEEVSFAYEDALDAQGQVKDQESDGLVLDNVSLEVPDGQFLCLIGHSGCGKSTLLRLLLGLSQPTSGTIRIDGRTVEGPDLDRSIVFQNYSLFPWMKARENVEFGIEQASKLLGRNLSKIQIRQRAQEYIERVGMADAAEKYPYQLSGGMQQRVAITRALAMDTQILFFDEPFGALDVRTRRSLQNMVDQLWRSGERRKTVVFVTHDISEAVLLADRVVFMGHGSILADISVDIPRPRSMEALRANPQAEALRAKLTDLFYQDGPLEDDELEEGFDGGFAPGGFAPSNFDGVQDPDGFQGER